MKPFGRRRFLGALMGSMALLPLKRIFSLAKAATALGAAHASVERPLKGVVVYYSATGNTAKIAMAIHRGMKSSMECDLLKVKKADPKKMAQYDVIGIGGPIWFFRDTANLKMFIYKMPPMDGKLCFPFCSHGTEPIGFFDSIWDSLARKNFTILGWNDWYGSVYQVLHMPKPYLTDGHPDEIDLAEAEAFGREMADRARRIAAGEQNVAPEIPQGEGIDPLWIRHDLPESLAGPGPRTGSSIGTGPVGPAAAAAAVDAVAASLGAAGSPGGRGGGPGGGTDSLVPGRGPGGPPGVTPLSGKLVPTLNMAACVYPRCDACIFACPVNAIEMSLAAPGRLASSPLVIKEACVSCGLCERMCVYEAITFQQMVPKSSHAIDMHKCTYPKCTVCADHCPMDAIDFSTRPPTFHRYCEGCDLCYSVCPHDAITVTNFAQSQLPLRMKDANHPFVRAVAKYEANGRFRRLVPMDKIGFDHPVFLNKNAPRIVLDENDQATYCDKPCKV